MTDSELLQQYVQTRSEDAFARLVQRHLDLVYSAALRQVFSRQLAEEVAQSVFLDLARSAATLKPQTVLTAWLYRVTRRTAIDVVRSESRRRLREQIALELADMKSPDTSWKEIEPLLDEAMETLEEADYSIILLRYFENKSLREVGEALGASEDAAQKRVARAVERLRTYLSNHGVAISSAGFIALVSAHAVQAAPHGLSAAIASAGAMGAALQTAGTMTAGKTIIMTTLQKTLVGAAIAAALGTAVYEACRGARLESQLRSQREEQRPLAEQNEQLRRERDAMAKQLELAREETDQVRRQNAETQKLRGEIARLRGAAQELAQLKTGDGAAPNDPTQVEMKSWLTRVSQLKQRLEAAPDKKTPELQFVTEQDWLDASRDPLDTDEDYRRALSHLRGAAEGKFIQLLQPALKQFLAANNEQFPTDLSQLQPYFKSAVDPAILQRYEIVPSESISNVKLGGAWVITQKGPVDEAYDSRRVIGPYGSGSAGPGSWTRR